MAYSFSHLYGIPTTGLRLFTVYGPWGRPDMAYFNFAKKMLKGEAISVFAEGKLKRDFTYIDDIVEGIVRVLFKPKAAAPGLSPHSIFNIGNHQPVRMLDFIRILEKALGIKANVEFLPMQPSEVLVTYADTAKLREHVNFAPATLLEHGLVQFIDWYKVWAGI